MASDYNARSLLGNGYEGRGWPSPRVVHLLKAPGPPSPPGSGCSVIAPDRPDYYAHARERSDKSRWCTPTAEFRRQRLPLAPGNKASEVFARLIGLN